MSLWSTRRTPRIEPTDALCAHREPDTIFDATLASRPSTRSHHNRASATTELSNTATRDAAESILRLPRTTMGLRQSGIATTS